VTETLGKTLGKLWENFGKIEVRGFPKLKNFGNFFPKSLGDYFLKGGIWKRSRALNRSQTGHKTIGKNLVVPLHRRMYRKTARIRATFFSSGGSWFMFMFYLFFLKQITFT
jgi:hypothetical protein